MTPSGLDFLQSVVMFDDRAYVNGSLPGEQAAVNDEIVDLSSVFTSPPSSTIPAEEWVDADDDKGGFDTQAIVRGFADKGMTCAVLAPTDIDAQGDTDRFLALARRADVIILDWLIGQNVPSELGVTRPASQNRTSMQLIIEVLRYDAEIGSRLRLMCVYTGTPDLASVQRQVFETLDKEFTDADVSSTDGQINITDARIVFLAKAAAYSSSLPVDGLSAEELPGRVVDEFMRFAAGGLLPHLAIQSLSAVRDQAHRMLKRFSASMDPALFAHRAMTTPEDTEEFVVDLVGDELRAIVANGFVTTLLDDVAIDERLSGLFAGRSKAHFWKAGRATAVTPTEIEASVAQQILSKGVSPKTLAAENPDGSKTKFQSETSLSSLAIAGQPDDVRKVSKAVDLDFSMLSSLSRDASLDGKGTSSPELHLGSILCIPASTSAGPAGATPGGRRSVSSTDRFFLCLQPLCDSTRLTDPAPFPLLPLAEVGPEADRFGLVVKKGGYRMLGHALKLGRVESVKFVPSRKTQTVVAKWVNDQWVFKGGARDFVWLGDVRIDKAHRLVNSLASDAGRIGINEYEYLRRRHE